MCLRGGLRTPGTRKKADSKRVVKAEPPEDFDDNPPWTEEDFRRARPAREVMPELIEAMKRARGRPKLERPKEQVSLRLDPDVLDAFHATGAGWQGRINDVLKRAAKKLRAA